MEKVGGTRVTAVTDMKTKTVNTKIFPCPPSQK